MPFTLAHPAAILPLRRFEFLHVIPLTVGSLVPDVPYYLPERLGRAFNYTHTFYGSFMPDLPLGIALLLFTLVMREPLTALLSSTGRWLCLTSIERFVAKRWNWLIAVSSLLVGIWTHIVWDSFTHPGGWTAARVDALSAPVDVFGWNTETNHLLQYISSILGLVVLIWWYQRKLGGIPTGPPELPLRRWVRAMLWSVIGLTATAFGVLQLLRHTDTATSSYYHIGTVLLTRICAWFAVLYFMVGVLIVLCRSPGQRNRVISPG